MVQRGRKKLKRGRKKPKKKKRFNFKRPFKPMPRAFHLPIETAVYVPSTRRNKRVPAKQYQKRITETRKKLSNMLGGYR